MRKSSIPSSNLTLQDYSESAIFAACFRLAHQYRKALALWQLPGTQQRHLIIDSSENLLRGKIDLEEAPSGFVFAPFNNPKGSESLLIEASIHITADPLHVLVHQELIADRSFIDDLEMELQGGSKDTPVFRLPKTAHHSTQAAYESMVEQALDDIAQHKYLKVVPATTLEIDLELEFSCLDTFDQLCKHYPNAFKSIVSIPQQGTWIGASPEPIIEVDRHRKFFTAALAGTQAYHQKVPIPEVAWRQKEIEEQALVSRYIINCFKKIRLREFEEVGPRTVIAGNLLHLKTTYQVDMEATNFPQLGTVMLDLLHPTSAVCGMPQLPAKKFIEEHEGFDRQYFSGYLGPLNMEEETHLFVNLRCLRLNQGSATLFAGAGVTADSHPHKEWIETQLKFDTLLAVIQPKA